MKGNGNVKTSMIALAAIALVLSASILMPVKQAEAAKPTHSDIQAVIDLASGYIDSLYKDHNSEEVGSSTHAVMAEYPSIPIRVERSDGSVLRAGEDANIYLTTKTTWLSDFTEVSADTISYKLGFRAVDVSTVYHDAPRLLVTVDYDYGASHNVRVSIKNEAWQVGVPITWADIYIGNSLVARATSANVGTTWTYTSSINHDNDAFFRSFRYIERHGTQLGREWYNAVGQTSKATELANRLTSEGYTLSRDIYSPMFGSASSQATNYQYQSGSSGVYRDCYTEPSMRDRSYQYHSKVCTIGVDTYIGISRTQDWLVPTLWAIHQLNKGVDADTDVNDGNQSWSPRDVARFVEGKWIADIGIKTATSNTHASAVRTAAFLVLETMLGYGPENDLTSKSYADKAASALMNPQVKANGDVIRENENGTQTTLERPMHEGGVYTSWNGFNYVAKKSILQQISDLFNQPDEHPDIKPSNAESTITVAQALRVFDCYNYGSNCLNTP